ncbi:Ig-like domain-containing protein [Pseudoalteromonas sp. T1lg75]|uniref:Ig-like domain-containing protein n=1 Tax=Pseudoalteromonas sp. T1lg75 TaxID=2077102 RepID=UPI000CF68B12|nr:Ig-like domain-containing protein [Pseudoalteromonas sp. T1lg75]
MLATYDADSFCPNVDPDDSECNKPALSSNGNLAATGSGPYINQFGATKSLYSPSNPALATAYIEFTKAASYTNFDLDNLTLEVDGTCDVVVTNNAGNTLFSGNISTGVVPITLSGNTSNLTSFRVTSSNCSNNTNYLGVYAFNTTPSNSAPSIANLNGDSLNTFSGSTVLLDQGTNATVSDSDSADFNGGNLTATITSGEDAAEDLLSVDTSGAVSLSGTTAGSNLSVSGTVIGTLANNIAAGNDFVTNFNANATPARVQTLLRALNYENTDSVSPTTGARNVRVTINDGDGGTSANQDITVTVLAANSDGNLSAATGVIEPVALSSTVDTSGEAANLFDFTLSDGGSGDNLAMAVSAIRVHVMGTSTDNDRAKVTWRLNGPDAPNVSGVYNAATDVITFPGLSISIADGGSEVYTINGYFNDNTNLVEKRNYVLTIDGDTDVTLGAGTRMGVTSPINNGTGSPIEVSATRLRFSTQPSGSVSGSALMTQPVVTATDAFGNTDTDFSETITLSEGSAGVLTNASASASSGIATFSGLTYTATADQQAFTLTANDQDGVGSDLPSVNANAVTADVVATKLVFSTEPAPTSIPAWQSTSFTTVPVVQAVDAINVVDQGYSTDITLSEVNGPGTAIMTATGDNDGNGSTVSLTPSSGTATFTSLQLTYSPAGADSEVFNLQASSGGLASANSTALTALDTIPPRVTGIALVGTPPANATQISYLVNFDSHVQNISSDDFALTTLSGDASGSVAMVSASSGSSVTVTVNNMAGSGTLRLDLKANTDITDDLGNGNGNNGYTPAFTGGEVHQLDLAGPTINTLSIADTAHKVGDTVSVSINASEPGASLVSGTVNGYALSGFSDLGGGNYSAEFTVVDGGQDIAASADVPVNLVLADGLNNQSSYTTPISQANDAIYANLPAISLSSDTNSIDEAGGVAQLTATIGNSLNNQWPEDIVVSLSYSGTAAVDTDYSRSPSITIGALTSSADIAITAIDDAITEDEETIIVDIASVGGGGVEDATQQATIIIMDDDNRAPSINGVPAPEVIAGQNYSFTPQATDPDNDILTFAITNKPGWASFDTGTGALSGVPTESDVDSYGNIQIMVSDGELSDQLPAFSINVLTANTAPVINTTSLSTEEDTTLTMELDISDETPEAIELSVSTEPAHGQITINGITLSYTPDANFNGQDSVTLIASDGQLQSQPTSILITVTGENDAPVAEDDVISLARAESGSYFLDVLANDSDPDSEDQLTITSANAELGEVSINDNGLLYTPIAGLNETVTLNYRVVDKAGAADSATVRFTLSGELPADTPQLTVPADVETNATGLYTKVNLGIATAVDSTGQSIPVQLLENPMYFTSGEHKVYWQVTDSEGRSALAAQHIRVHPQISFAADSTASEGGSHKVHAYLSGSAPSYPLVIPYSVGGSSDNSDHSLIDGELVFHSEHSTLSMDIYDDNLDEGDETIIISLSEQSNLGARGEHRVTISEANLAPGVTIKAQQGQQARTLYRQDEDIQLHAQVTDANHDDSHTYSWQVEPALTLSDAHSAEVTLAANNLVEGVYKITVTVSDNGSPALSTTVLGQLDIRATVPPLDEGDSDGDLLPDQEEGFIDLDGDGVSDHLDALTPCHLMAAVAGQEQDFILASEPGTCLHTSPYADSAQAGARLNPEALSPDPDGRHVGTLYGVVVSALATQGSSVQLVLPQHQPVPGNAQYRKFVSSQWQDLHLDERNAVASALGSRGYCPAPGSEQWQAGLNLGHWCVQLTLEDGGANDGDGMVNGYIDDPGVIALSVQGNQAPVANDDAYRVPQDSDTSLNVLSNDTDADGDELQLLNVESTLGQAEILDNQILYRTPSQYLGMDTLLYSIADSQGNTHSAKVQVNIAANQAPIANDDEAETWYRTTVTLDVLSNDSDPEGRAIRVVEASSEQGEVSINADYSLSFTPMDQFSGTATVDYVIADEFGAQAAAKVMVKVAEPQPPVEPPKRKLSSGTVNLYWLLLLAGLLATRRTKRS